MYVYPFRSVLILAAMQAHAHWQLGLNAMLASAAQANASSKAQPHCVDLLLDHVTLKNSVLASLLTAQRIYTSKMDLRVMITRLTATQERARLMTHSVKDTFYLVGAYNMYTSAIVSTMGSA